LGDGREPKILPDPKLFVPGQRRFAAISLPFSPAVFGLSRCGGSPREVNRGSDRNHPLGDPSPPVSASARISLLSTNRRNRQRPRWAGPSYCRRQADSVSVIDKWMEESLELVDRRLASL